MLEKEKNEVGEYLTDLFTDITNSLPPTLREEFANRYESLEVDPYDQSIGAIDYFKNLLLERVDLGRQKVVKDAIQNGSISQLLHEALDFKVLVNLVSEAYKIAFQPQGPYIQKMIGIFVNRDYLDQVSLTSENSGSSDKFQLFTTDEINSGNDGLGFKKEDLFFSLQRDLHGRASSFREVTVIKKREEQLSIFGNNSAFSEYKDIQVAIIPVKYGDDVIAITIGVASNKVACRDYAFHGDVCNMSSLVSDAFARATVSLMRIEAGKK